MIRLVVVVLALAGCGGPQARLRFVSSQATQASWSFVVDDHGRGAQLLIDGRFRYTGCDRAGRTQRCELRGLFPGGHTVEARLPGAVLRRSVVLGRPWPARPVLVRVQSADDAKAAAQAGADAVVAHVGLGLAGLQDVAEAAHGRSARLIVEGEGAAEAVETAAADGVLGQPLPDAIKRRFPEAMVLSVDAAASRRVAHVPPGGPLPDAGALVAATGLVEARGLLGGALALLGPRGAIVDAAAFPLLGARKRHAALRGGEAQLVEAGPERLGFTLSKGGDHVTVLVNAGPAPWPVKTPQPAHPLDLLGGRVDGDTALVAPGDVALLIQSPQPDRTRF